jgi:hypothetical protein
MTTTDGPSDAGSHDPPPGDAEFGDAPVSGDGSGSGESRDPGDRHQPSGPELSPAAGSEAATEVAAAAALAERDRVQEAATKRRVLWLRVGLAGFVVLVAVGITLSFISTDSTSKADLRPQTFTGIGAGHTNNYLEVDEKVGLMTPATSVVAVRIDVIPHGIYAVNIYALSQAVHFEVDGLPGGHVTYVAGQTPDPINGSFELQGNLSQYPFDSYRWFLAVRAYGGPKFTQPLPVRVELSSTQHDWRVTPQLASVRANGTVDINLYADRSVGTIALALFEMFVMVAIATIAIAISYNAIAGNHELSWGLFGWLGAMLFALPAIRNAMPSVPNIGTLVDYTVYFWAILTIAVCLLTIGITYIRRTIKIEEHGK